MTEATPGATPLALIIEDNESVAGICRIALQQAGFEVELAEDGAVALERLATLAPTLILLDLHLPRVSGQQVLHHIHSHKPRIQARVILATADLLKAETLSDQVDFVLVKPFGFLKLYELARELRFSSLSL